MSDEIENKVKESGEPGDAGCIGIGFSFFFPIVGVIMYFVQKKAVSNPSAYLYAALGGFCLGFLLRVMQGAFAS